ncbi:TniQ family protein [Streptomyces sp. NPDC058847]|uniref:TniQ family protein n=1 Tax=Streptomyces sp. NPDC058847 TaxID=3346649 RepID=UPI0036BA95AB
MRARRQNVNGASSPGRGRTTGTRRRSRRPASPLPRQVRLIGDESTASFVTRLAALNRLPVEDLMDRVGDGTRPMPVQSTEVYLNAPALQRLAALSGHGAALLQRALPHLRSHHLLADGPQPVWQWPQWRPKGPLFLVRACDLCAQARRRPSEVYLVSVTRWRVCARHHRWLDNLREAGTTWLSLGGLPDVVDAHRQRLMLERRLGAGGRALFADALHLTAFWWNIPSLSPPVWAARRSILAGPVGSDLRIAPLVCYPEAVHLAHLLAQRERRRMRDTGNVYADRDWLDHVGGTLEDWNIPVLPALLPVDLWMQHHSSPPLADGEPRPAQGRWRRLPAPLPHTGVLADTHLEELTCLPWRFGDESRRPDATQVWSVAGQA